MTTRSFWTFLLGALPLFAISDTGRAQPLPAPAHLVVVELFQSQGCSSCPPAEANLNAIAGQPNILALSFGVTYWDSLGWKDTFATEAYTDRQWAYAKHRKRDNVWTPQVYVNGHADLVGDDRTQLDQAIAHASSEGPQLSWEKDQLRVSAGKPAATCDVWLVRYDPRTINVAIGAGENGGRTLPHRNVVRELVHLGTWDGSPHSFAVPPSALKGLSTAALVQVTAGGDILGASMDSAAR
ncbi:MAG: DUF1223 domain-containing protein [Rhodanobacter sp.]